MFTLKYKANTYKEKDLISLPKNLPSDVIDFLKNWYDDKDYIIVYTSGSTGNPKQIQLKKETLIKSAKRSNDFFKLDKNKTALLCLSCNYIAGKLMIIRALIGNYKLILENTNQTPLLKINEPIDFTAMVPVQVEESLKQTPEKIQLIKQIIIGGGSINQYLKKNIVNSKLKAYATFGMTETATHIALQKIELNNNYFTPLNGVKISHDENNCLIINDTYLNINVKTNDIVKIKNHQFKFLGRKDNIINSGGIKIQPEKLEKKISKLIPFPFFISSIPDDKWGNLIILLVENEHFKIDLEIINKYLDQKEKIRAIYLLKSFAYTKTNKINRTKTLSEIK